MLTENTKTMNTFKYTLYEKNRKTNSDEVLRMLRIRRWLNDNPHIGFVVTGTGVIEFYNESQYNMFLLKWC